MSDLVGFLGRLFRRRYASGGVVYHRDSDDDRIPAMLSSGCADYRFSSPGIDVSGLRRRPAPMPREFEALARYNAEVARGILHTPEWRAAMADLQARFDEWRAP